MSATVGETDSVQKHNPCPHLHIGRHHLPKRTNIAALTIYQWVDNPVLPNGSSLQCRRSDTQRKPKSPSAASRRSAILLSSSHLRSQCPRLAQRIANSESRQCPTRAMEQQADPNLALCPARSEMPEPIYAAPSRNLWSKMEVGAAPEVAANTATSLTGPCKHTRPRDLQRLRGIRFGTIGTSSTTAWLSALVTDRLRSSSKTTSVSEDMHERNLAAGVTRIRSQRITKQHESFSNDFKRR